MESLYLERFKKLDDVAEKFTLRGNLMLVERIPEPEKKTKSGIVLPNAAQFQVNTLDQDVPNFCYVLALGEGYTDGSLMDVERGDVVIIPKLSIKYFSFFGEIEDYKPDTIGLTTEDSIQLRFKGGTEAYQKFFDSLNGK